MTDYNHYMEPDGEVYSTSGEAFTESDRKVAFVIREDELPEVTEDGLSPGAYLWVEGLSGRFYDSDHFAGDNILDMAKGLVAMHLFREARAARQREEEEQREAQRLVDLFNEIDANPHGWYAVDKPLIRELVKRGVRAPKAES